MQGLRLRSRAALIGVLMLVGALPQPLRASDSVLCIAPSHVELEARAGASGCHAAGDEAVELDAADATAERHCSDVALSASGAVHADRSRDGADVPAPLLTLTSPLVRPAPLVARPAAPVAPPPLASTRRHLALRVLLN